MAARIDLTIVRGKTFEYGLLYAESRLVYRPITAIPLAAPLRLTIAGHGIPDGWPIQIQSVRNPSELNTAPGQFEQAILVDEDTIEINRINATGWREFGGVGLVVYRNPVDISGWQCRATVKDRVGGNVLFRWHSDVTQDHDGLITVDEALSQFVLAMDADVSAGLEWSQGLYDVEAISPDGAVLALTGIGKISVADEVTT